MYPTISIPQLHLEYRVWVSELNFYKEEVRIFEHHLENLVKRQPDRQVAAQVEHFQNSFICQKDVIDRLKHNLHVSEKQLTSFVHEMSGMGLDSIRMDNHPELREQMQLFRKTFIGLKNNFRQFEAERL